MRASRLRFLLFFSLVTTLLALAYFYTGGQIARIIPRGPVQTLLWTVLIIAFVALPLTFIARLFYENMPGFEFIAWVAYTGFGLVTLLLTIFLIRDAVISAVRYAAGLWPALFPWEAAFGPGANIATVVLGLALGVGGIVAALRTPRIKQVTVSVPGLHAGLDGFKIVQITDMHIGPTIRRAFVERVVNIVNSLSADLIAVTGDLVDGGVDELRDHAQPLSRLQARHGAFFVTGNHEYYSGAVSWVKEVTRLGMRALMNEHVNVMHGGASLIVGGVTDITAHAHIPSHASDPHAAMNGAPPSDFRLMLAHQPRSIYEAAEAGFDLVLCGHTHGGQYFPGTLIVRMVQPFIAGLHLYGKTQIYVSRGTGYWGPPLRIGAPSEVTLLTLRSA